MNYTINIPSPGDILRLAAPTTFEIPWREVNRAAWEYFIRGVPKSYDACPGEWGFSPLAGLPSHGPVEEFRRLEAAGKVGVLDGDPFGRFWLPAGAVLSVMRMTPADRISRTGSPGRPRKVKGASFPSITLKLGRPEAGGVQFTIGWSSISGVEVSPEPEASKLKPIAP